jgi:2-polyprenyl-6-methoxyphenol hydroxylase-like FAD-dependent oxidoreductase
MGSNYHDHPKAVGIVGAGYSGLTLALRLQQLGMDPVLYVKEPPDAMRAAPLTNTVGRFAHTIAREHQLGVDHWATATDDMPTLQFRSVAPLEVSYEGRFRGPMRATDFRLLLPRLLDDFIGRGGDVIVTRTLDLAAIDRASNRHELIVVAVGSGSIQPLFPVDEARSPYRQPQRLLFAGVFDGLERPERNAVSMNLSPMAGGIFQMAFRTAEGDRTSLLVSAIPDGPLAPVARLSPDDAAFAKTLRAALEVHAPAIADRIEPSAFGVAGRREWLHGAVTPTVRQAWSTLPSGRIAVAIGDAWITNDPLTGQGANLGSRCAFTAAEHIAAGGPYDALFARRLEAAMWRFAGPVTAFSNAFLQMPPPHVIELVMAAGAHRAVADRYVDLFNDPTTMWETMSSPDTVRAFIDAALQPVGGATPR